MSSGIVTIHTDGASRGNPGPAAYAYIIQRDGAEDIEVKGRLEDTTNNVAEYMALVRALEHAKRLGARRLAVATDSELMARQVEGSYKVKNEGLRPLYEQVRDLWDEFESATIRHVPREQNRRADRLCNEVLDAGKKAPARSRPKAGANGKEQRPDVRAAAVECLRDVAGAWARGNPADPRPEDVWDQLWTILEENGVVK